MNDIIDFIDFYTLEPKIYLQVSTIDPNRRVEIQWCGPGVWRIKEIKELFWVEVVSEELQEALQIVKADLGEVERCLFNIALEQIVGAHFILDSGKEFFGESVISDAIASYIQFKEELIDTIDVLEEKKKPKLFVVKNDKKK